MARLPSGRYLIQQIGGEVVLFEDLTEREIVRFDPGDCDAAAKAQKVVHASELSDEDKCFAHFWSGYFYAHACRDQDAAVIKAADRAAAEEARKSEAEVVRAVFGSGSDA